MYKKWWPVVLGAGLVAAGVRAPGAPATRTHAAPVQVVAGAATPETFDITPVEGPSNLQRLGLTIEQSAMGSAGTWEAKPEPQDVRGRLEVLTRPFIVSGGDLYRIDCRACHREDGTGSPPEIGSLLGPVQSASAVMMEERMKKLGRPIAPAFARQLAAQSHADLLKRLNHGGTKMPSFEHLTGKELEALLDYLNLLAGVPRASARQLLVTEPPARVGEHLVKGTCHTCHDATGPWPNPQQLLQGAVPPLSGLTQELTMPQVIEKVRHGAPITMGRAMVPYRGRMPVFSYLTDSEVAAAYLYLLLYPPR